MKYTIDLEFEHHQLVLEIDTEEEDDLGIVAVYVCRRGRLRQPVKISQKRFSRIVESVRKREEI